jgi:hypothetical protein
MADESQSHVSEEEETEHQPQQQQPSENPLPPPPLTENKASSMHNFVTTETPIIAPVLVKIE